MAKTIFLTGATGFLGSHLLAALLRRGDTVIALARPGGGVSGRARIEETLTRALDSGGDAGPIAGRLEVEEGDIATPGLGLSGVAYRSFAARTDEVWHSAASLSFLEEEREEIFHMNVDGARRMVEFTAQSRGRRLHHVSTAYVAGTRRGVVLESEADVGQTFKNPYEESKCRAETLIAEAAAAGDVTASIHRPSIVIGDSVTGRATHFHGVYAFIKGLWTVARRLRRGQPDATVVELPLRLLGAAESTLNFVPIDYVTGAIMAIAAQASSAGGTFHLTNPEATPNRLWLEVICDQIGIQGVRFAPPESFASEPMTRLETVFHRQMAFYAQYLSAEPRFDGRRTRAALDGTGIRCPGATPAFTRKMTGWYIDRLNGGAD